MNKQDNDRTQTHMILTNGTMISHYRIINKIGAGGMGEVYLAEDTKLNRRIALKFLPSHLASNRDLRIRFTREAQAAAKLDHPNIVPVHEVGEYEGLPYIAMAHIDGESLRDVIKKGKLTISESVALTMQLCDGLQKAHEAGIVHRDIKPGNIIIDNAGRARILDFGLSTITGDDKLTKAGSTLGTVGYMAPEQISGMNVDKRADLFSLGVILFEMISGRRPFTGDNDAAVIKAISDSVPEPIARYKSGVTGELQRIVSKSLAKDPSLRYQTADGLLADLKQVSMETAQPKKSRIGLWTAVVIIGAIAIFFAVRSGVFDSIVPTSGTEVTSGTIRSIAVLPLDNYSGDPSQDYFAEGMTDELTATLATISQLRVISRGSAMQFSSGNRPATPEIARLLAVDAVVEGSVTRVGDKVRITAQLIDAREDKSLWAHSFERSSSDVLALQADLATAIANEINLQLTPVETSRLASTPKVDPVTHDAYLRGRYFFNRPSDDNLKKAIAQFQEAIQLDPEFAAAYSGLSDAYLWAGYNEGFMTASEARPLAEAAAIMAVKLDSNSAEAHTSLAVFKLFYEYDWVGSELEFRRAIELNPSYAYAHDQFVLGLSFQGRFDEALAEGKKAAALDPLSPQILIDNCVAYIMKGDFERAHELAQEASDIDPTYFFPVMIEGWINCEEGKFKEATPLLLEANEMGAPPFVTAWLAYAYGSAGEIDRAKEQGEKLKSFSLNGKASPFNLALVSLGLGEKERAIDYLEQAYESDSQWLGWLKGDRIFDPLRSEPGFIALLKNLGFEQ